MLSIRQYSYAGRMPSVSEQLALSTELLSRVGNDKTPAAESGFTGLSAGATDLDEIERQLISQTLERYPALPH